MIFMKKLTTRLLSLVLLGAFIPSFVLADSWYLENGDITIKATSDTSQTVTQGENSKEDSNPTISNWDPNGNNAGNTGSTSNTIIIEAAAGAKANVTLENVNIDVSSKSEAAITTQGQGDVTLNLSGNNSVQSGTYHAGVHKENTGNLTVTAPEGGTGSLNATGGQGGAGIGGGSSSDRDNGNNITISGGTIVARGGEYSAGIGGGGGSHRDASKITISGGNVTATGAGSAAGIGGGNGGSGTDIEITGGKVTATGGAQAAGIGGGNGGSGSDITVSGGTVIATGKDDYDGGGAGIGGGSGGNGSDITVSNGTVNATGGNYSAGIGGGKNGSGSDITVSGGNVTAKGGGFGAGIGGGINKDGSRITVSGGKVNATGDPYGAGIGGGQSGSGKNILISGGEVTANSNAYGAGIGGGWKGEGDTITVSGGKVTANGGYGGAGIGGGEYASGNDITISGGQVTAMGGRSGAGIGGGAGKEEGSGNVTVSGEAQVKVKGGAWRGEDICGDGAPIGNGGYYNFGTGLPGDGISPNINDLKVDGFIQYYSQGADIKTEEPYETTAGTVGDHSWDDGEVTTPATCTTEGVMTYTCKNPDHGKKTEPIPKLNHDFKTYIYDNNATCEADGTETAKCERCNETDTRTKVGSKLGHLFETYVYNNDATYEKDGTETAKCERCDATDTRTAKGSKLTGNTAETAVEVRQEAYWVCGSDGQALPYHSQVKDGVLTVTVQADTASLRGTTGSLRQLEAQGITGIRFVTNRAQSDFTLSDLLTSGTGSFTLTHDGDKVTFTLENTDIIGILK